MAVVGLDTASYITVENSGMIEVCARVLDPEVDCPVSFPFDITFSTADGSAGNHLQLRESMPMYMDMWSM